MVGLALLLFGCFAAVAVYACFPHHHLLHWHAYTPKCWGQEQLPSFRHLLLLLLLVLGGIAIAVGLFDLLLLLLFFR